MSASYQPCVCIARCNHCISGAVAPAEAADAGWQKILRDHLRLWSLQAVVMSLIPEFKPEALDDH